VFSNLRVPDTAQHVHPGVRCRPHYGRTTINFYIVAAVNRAPRHPQLRAAALDRLLRPCRFDDRHRRRTESRRSTSCFRRAASPGGTVATCARRSARFGEGCSAVFGRRVAAGPRAKLAARRRLRWSLAGTSPRPGLLFAVAFSWTLLRRDGVLHRRPDRQLGAAWIGRINAAPNEASCPRCWQADPADVYDGPGRWRSAAQRMAEAH
jgi:hypothetical protein